MADRFFWGGTIFIVRGFFFFLLMSSGFALAATQSWIRWAHRFTGESDFVRAEAIRQLKNIKGLDNLMKRELWGQNDLLALDVIATIPLPQLREEVIKKAKTDTTGFVYLTLNALITPSNFQEIVRFYVQQLEKKASSPAAQTVILDTLGRLEWKIDRRLVGRLLKSSSPEVRSAVLSYLRPMGSHFSSEDQAIWLKDTLRSEPYQLRVQALLWVAEWPGARREELSADLKKCGKDEIEAVRTLCRRLSRQESL